MAVKKGLGRGFDSLIPTQLLDEAFDPTAKEDTRLSEYKHVAVAAIQADPGQPRRHFEQEALDELAESIKVHGVLQPIVVTPNGDNYVIVAGERRWRAAKQAGTKEIPVIVRTLSDQNKLELSLIENLHRRDLNPLETATAYAKLRDQFNLTYEEVSQRLGGRAISTISNIVRLLNLPSAAKEALVEGKISEAHARQILAIPEPRQQQVLLDLIIRNKWSVRKTEQYVIGYKLGDKNRKAGEAKARSETPATRKLAKHLDAPVQVKTMAKGGQLMIRYKSDQDLERIIESLL
ncbi:MAG TPA: ParB/RepB/Spo0J family partition protein [Candidatus Saccharimonadales bacterium]